MNKKDSYFFLLLSSLFYISYQITTALLIPSSVSGLQELDLWIDLISDGTTKPLILLSIACFVIGIVIMIKVIRDEKNKS